MQPQGPGNLCPPGILRERKEREERPSGPTSPQKAGAARGGDKLAAARLGAGRGAAALPAADPRAVEDLPYSTPL